MFGARGEWYVVIQGLLFALVVFGPASVAGLPAWPIGSTVLFRVSGLALIVLGLVVAVFAAWNLGRSLTPLPYPKKDAELVTTGLFGYVRHPIYFGVILLAFGWSIYTQGTLLRLRSRRVSGHEVQARGNMALPEIRRLSAVPKDDKEAYPLYLLVMYLRLLSRWCGRSRCDGSRGPARHGAELYSHGSRGPGYRIRPMPR